MTTFTSDDIIRMAREAATQHGHTINFSDEIVETLMSFAELVTAAERKARQDAQIQNEELKARIARVGLEGNLAKAKAVKAEREACAQVCDSVYHQHIGPQYGEVRHGIAACAAAIRARGAADCSHVYAPHQPLPDGCATAKCMHCGHEPRVLGGYQNDEIR